MGLPSPTRVWNAKRFSSWEVIHESPTRARDRDFQDPARSWGHCGNVGEAFKRGVRRGILDHSGCGGWGLGDSGHTSVGAGGNRRLLAPALIETVVRDRVQLSGIERVRLVEAVGEGFLGEL